MKKYELLPTEENPMKTLYNDTINMEPLRGLFDMDEDNRILGFMLNGNESFEKEKGKTLVTPDDIIKKIYEAIFINQYDGRAYRTILGEYQFTKDTKTLAINNSNMMTAFADLS